MEKKFNEKGRRSSENFFMKDRRDSSGREARPERGTEDSNRRFPRENSGYSSSDRDSSDKRDFKRSDAGERNSGERRSFNPNFDSSNRLRRPSSDRPDRPYGASPKRSEGDRGPRSFDRDNRGERSSSRDSRPERNFNREDRGERSFSRDNKPERSFSREDRGDRGFNRDNRGERSFSGENRGDRGFNRDNRGERSFNRDGKPERSFSGEDRGDRGFNRDNRGERSFSRDSKPERSFSREDRGDRGSNRDNRGERSFNRDGKPEGNFSREDRGDRGFNRDNRGERSFNRDGKPEGNFSREDRGDRGFNRDNRRFDGDRGDKKPFESRPRRSFGENTSDGGFRGRDDSNSPQRGRTGSGDRPFSRDRREGSDNREQRFVRDDKREFKPNNGREDTTTYEPKPLINRDIRLNRYIAMSGICSRREADMYIETGVVSINDVVVTELGTKVTPSDVIKFNGDIIRGEKKIYVVMNKPKGFVTTIDDPNAEHIVMDLIGDKVKERIYPVGRLDKNTLGVLLLTNDGELTKELTHPSFNKKKIYHIVLDKAFKEDDMSILAEGIELEDGIAYADEISHISADLKEVGLETHNGRNRIVRRMFEQLGYKVQKLDRVYFAGLTKKGLQRGHWRYLTPREVSTLKGGSYQ